MTEVFLISVDQYRTKRRDIYIVSMKHIEQLFSKLCDLVTTGHRISIEEVQYSTDKATCVWAEMPVMSVAEFIKSV